MTLYRLGPSPRFPDPRHAEPHGLLAVGGDLSPARLLEAYAHGIFPWFNEGDPLLWWSPPERAVFLPGDEHFSARTLRALRKTPFEIRVDSCFAEVVVACAAQPRPGQEGTWISPGMQAAYVRLHEEGYAHAFEVFLEGRLVGGLYGLSLGAAFFGESMFSAVPYASRAAFQALCQGCWAQGFHLIDGQLPNENLAQLGARILDREAFLGKLKQALALPTRRGPWKL